MQPAPLLAEEPDMIDGLATMLVNVISDGHNKARSAAGVLTAHGFMQTGVYWCCILGRFRLTPRLSGVQSQAEAPYRVCQVVDMLCHSSCVPGDFPCQARYLLRALSAL